ncbi:DNA polymerase Y family protein [Thioalkalivibrio sp. ALJ16]|uniref:Y-family DNA polymerase n=1 Tax=Thioalkalivibrio sp. ALJ16 TaxID=1158762 RepID=UPI0003602507|nr:DNA polymerase Y family protein [Thioalkalivibrio sp. ALJ16]
MAVELPHLALEQLARSASPPAGGTPLLVVESGPRPRVHAASRAARRAGVRPGMALVDALAVLDTPHLVEYDPAALHAQLERLAGVLLQFSDHVHPEPAAQRIMLEVGRSRRLFGGLEALREQARQTLAALGFHARIGLARSPAAARLLAGLRHPDIPETAEALRRTLGPVSLQALPLSAATREALQATGLRRLEDLLRLSRDALAQRHGLELIRLLDQLLGRQPETLPRFSPPAELDLPLRLDHEIHATTALAFPLKRLLRQAEAQLRGIGRSLQGMTLDLQHRETRTRLELELGEPDIRATQWLGLWQTRLERVTLEAPVIGLRLRAERLLDPPTTGAALLATAPDDHATGITPTAPARIRARLGNAAVFGLENRLTPLPEAAQQPCPQPEAMRRTNTATPSQEVCGSAFWVQDPASIAPQGALQPLGRLEDGWWDHGRDQRRDYALARDPRGRRLWLFRCLRSGQWFHQGYWG